MIFVDAHVHVHECFEPETFFSSALENFSRVEQRFESNDASAFVLSLTETARADYFSALARIADSPDNTLNHRFRVCRTQEKCSLRIESVDNSQLFVIAGRQIVTSERLELLALGTERCFEDGMPMVEALRQVASANALAVVPWGFGKWYGRRGKIFDEVLQGVDSERFFLGDNSGRPGFMPEPKQFHVAREKGIRILPGSDPLPFATEAWRAGSFGYCIPGALTNTTPASNLLHILADTDPPITPYGRLENPFRFFKNQVAMQFIKRKC